MKDNRILILGLLSFLFCALLSGTVYYLGGRLNDLHAQADDLQQKIVDMSGSTQTLMEQKVVFTNAFKDLEHYRVNAAPSELAFYSDVQQVVQNNGIEILSSRQQGVNEAGFSAIAMTVRGEYYALMQVLAAWRNLPTTVRVSALTLGPDKPIGSSEGLQGWVQADVTVEAIVASQP